MGEKLAMNAALKAYLLRKRRQLYLWRAFRARRQLSPVRLRVSAISKRDILVFASLRNERIRLPYFLEYYRKLGVAHFLIVDNASGDGTAEYLAEQADVSLWSTSASYKAAGFGINWMNWLLRKYGSGHWCLTVDPDEFFVYPFCDTRPLSALTDWLESHEQCAFPAMLLDMYPKGPVSAQPYREGTNPFTIARWFDSGNYSIRTNAGLQNLWIQGGPRARMFFTERPKAAPALNKTPLILWNKKYAYVSSTHMALPRMLNRSYSVDGGERASGVLLHAKFISVLTDKVEEELARRQHYAESREYEAYARGITNEPDMWTPSSTEYLNWRQLEILGLISKGEWA